MKSLFHDSGDEEGLRKGSDWLRVARMADIIDRILQT